MEDKKVTMFVWNYFTNDARVYKECLTLEEVGLSVDLIAIASTKEEKNYLELPRTEISRVSSQVPPLISYPIALGKIIETLVKGNIVSLCICVCISVLLFFLSSKIYGALIFLFLLLPYKKIGTICFKLTIFLRMISTGLKSKGDIIHSNDLNTLLQGVLISKVFTKNKKILIYDSHEIQISRTGYNSIFYYYFERSLIKYCDVIFQENETRSQFFLSVYGKDTEILHNYPMAEKPEQYVSFNLKDKYQIPHSTTILMYQGGLQTGRGLHNLMKSMSLMKDLDIVLLAIGDGKIKLELEDLVKKLDIESKVIFTGKIKLFELPTYTIQADIGFQLLENVCYNHYSAASNKLFEYIMSLTPVIGIKFPEIKEVITQNDVGVVILENTPEAIEEATRKLVEDREKLNKKINNCKQARLKYTWEKEKETIKKVYLKQLERI